MLTEKVHSDILKVIDAVEFISESEYALNGLRRDISNMHIIDPSGHVNVSPVVKQPAHYAENFCRVLTADIYQQLYSPAEDANSQIPDTEIIGFRAKLSHANQGSGTWEAGWKIIGVEAAAGEPDGKIIVSNGILQFWANAVDVSTGGNTFVAGAECQVRVGKEVQSLNPHFFMVYGNLNKDEVDGFAGKMLRFYWNLTAAGAIKYIELVTDMFNHAGILFKTKVLSDSQAYKRTDGGVLYTDSSQLRQAVPLLMRIHAELQPFLGANVPLFTRKMAHGLAFAEDPATGESFGISRASIIARGMHASFSNGRTRPQEMLQSVHKHLARAGIEPQHPYSYKTNRAMYERILNNSATVNH